MFIGSFGMKGLPGCGAGSGCDELNRGRWSKWGPIPVAGFGFATYSILFSAALLLQVRLPAESRHLVAEVFLTALLIAFGSVVWFVAGDKHGKRGRVGGQNRATRSVERYPIFPRMHKNSIGSFALLLLLGLFA
jgi:uncharacterized membrane protein YbhN (UPF0104 family)